jgi:hypothetical protein
MCYNSTFYSCYMFRLYKTIIRQVYTGIRTVIELPIWIQSVQRVVFYNMKFFASMLQLK